MGSTSVMTIPGDFMELFKNYSLFRAMTQDAEEPLDVFASRVAQQSLLIETFCDEDRILQAKYQVLWGMNGSKIREGAIHHQWTLEELMTEKQKSKSNYSIDVECGTKMEEEIYDDLPEQYFESEDEKEEEDSIGVNSSLEKEDHKSNKKGRLKCNDCNVKYSNEASLIKHRKKEYNCIECNLGIRCLKKFRQHTIESHQKYYCISCNTYYDSMYFLKKHRSESHIRQPFKCKLCENEFPSRIEYKSHMENTCSECKLCSETRELAAQHLKDVHQQTAKNQCHICDKVLCGTYALKIHIKSMHEPDSKIHQCHLCPGKFAFERLLKSHVLRIHHNKEFFRCEKCSKGFSSPKQLQSHNDSVHEKKVASICHICSTVFYRARTLKSHIERVHEGIKRHKCSQCDMAFYHRSGLVKHSKAVHEKTMDFKCEYCGRLFNRKTVMDLHIKSIHTLEKNYKCETCGKTYVSKYHLTRHIKEGHEHFTRECDICHKRFAGYENGNLKKHKRAVHGIK